MKRKLFTILFVMLSLFTLTSCITTVEAQDGVYTTSVINVDDIEMAITYGTPYIINDAVQYYFYNNLYYYPFYTNGYWYYRVYTRPLIRYPHYWRPVPRSYWFRNGRYYNPHRFNHRPHYNRPHYNNKWNHIDRQHNRPSINNRPTVRPQNRPQNRPNWNSRPSSTRSTVGRPSINRSIPHQNSNGRFSGRR